MPRKPAAVPCRVSDAQDASVTAVQYCSRHSRDPLFLLCLAVFGVVPAFVINAGKSSSPSSGTESFSGSFELADQRLAGEITCDFQEMSGTDMSAQFAEHRRSAVPVRIQNVTAGWKLQDGVEPAQFRHLLEGAGCCVMLRGDKGGGVPSETRINFSREVWDDLSGNTSNVVFNVEYSPIYWALKGLYIIPHIFREIRRNPILSLGSHGSGIFTHQHDANFLTQVQGTKLWFIAPPDASLPIRHPCTYIAQRPPGVKACAIRPGETIYLPDRWHHATCNLGGEGVWGQWNLAVGGQGESTSWQESFHALADGDISRLREALRETLASLKEARRKCSKCGKALWRQLVALLHFAARAGSLDGIKAVLDEVVGTPHDAPLVEVDARDPYGGYGQIKGGTALHVAAWHGHLMLVQELLRHGAEVGAKLKSDESDVVLRASELASNHGHLTTASLLKAEEERG